MNHEMLNMTPYDFDQSEKGWRLLDKQGKYLEAAELIVSYIAANEDKIKSQSQVSIQTIYFHAGQEYACAGAEHYAKAISFFSKSHKSREDWDVYVDGTIAFLEGDRDKLETCADDLNKMAEADPRLSSNAKLLHGFLEGLSPNKTYLEVYGA